MEKWYIGSMVGIYKILSPSGRVYIGQSWDIEKRFSWYSSVKPTTQKLLYRSFNKHGVKNHKFDVICELPSDVSQEILDKYEIFY